MSGSEAAERGPSVDAAIATRLSPSRVPAADVRVAQDSAGIAIGLKRAMDVSLAAVGLVALAPVMLLIAIAVKADSRGPALFTQVRIGKNRRRSPARKPSGMRDRRRRSTNGMPFTMYKFRTMRASAPKYSTKPANPRDQRITSVGRFLRRTSLDELPQLYNVLRGEMSLVGPRPEMPFIVKQYNPVHCRRLEMTPGVTGLWQLHGPRDRQIHEAIEWDLRYVERWSLRLDFRILVETVLFAVRGQNR